MTNFKIYKGVLEKYTGHDKHVVIPEGVTIIGKDVFEDNQDLETISLPESVNNIQYCGFI